LQFQKKGQYFQGLGPLSSRGGRASSSSQRASLLNRVRAVRFDNLSSEEENNDPFKHMANDVITFVEISSPKIKLVCFIFLVDSQVFVCFVIRRLSWNFCTDIFSLGHCFTLSVQTCLQRMGQKYPKVCAEFKISNEVCILDYQVKLWLNTFNIQTSSWPVGEQHLQHIPYFSEDRIRAHWWQSRKSVQECNNTQSWRKRDNARIGIWDWWKLNFFSFTIISWLWIIFRIMAMSRFMIGWRWSSLSFFLGNIRFPQLRWTSTLLSFWLIILVASFSGKENSLCKMSKN